MNRSARSAVALLVAVMVGCASAATEKSSVIERERVNTGVNATMELTHDALVNETLFNAARTDVWNALLAAHDQLGIPVQDSNAANGTISYFAPSLSRTLMGKPLSRYFDCGNGPGGQSRADTYRLSLKIVEIVDSVAAGQLRLRTETQANARNQAVSSDAVYCNSTMQLEKLIAILVAQQLNR